MATTSAQKEIAKAAREVLGNSNIERGSNEYWRVLTNIMHQKGLKDPAQRGVCGRAVDRLLRSFMGKRQLKLF